MAHVIGRAAALALALAAFGPLAACDDEPGETPADMEPVDRGSMIGDGEVEDAEPPVDMGDDMAPADMAPVDADMGGSDRPPCNDRANLGFEAAPAPIVDTKAFAPRAVFTGSEYGVVWQTAGAAGAPNTVWFQRFDRGGAPLGSPVELGVAEVPQHAVVFDGANYVTAWLAVRTVDTVFDGIKIKVLNGDGTPSAAPALEIPSTFDSEQLAFAWAQFGGGMVLYNRGRTGEGGIYANAIGPDFSIGPQVQLTDSPSQSPAVTFGDGAWGAAWLARDGEEPNELAFVLLDDAAAPLAEEARVQGGGIGNVRIAYGQGIYGVGWTRLFGAGLPQAALTLVDGGGDPFATPPLAGPTGVATVTDVAFLAPDRFAIGWQESAGGSSTRVGVSRITAQGLMTDPVALDPPSGSAWLGMTLGGTGTRIGVWFTADPMPSPVGFSDAARVVTGNLAPCD